MTTATEILENVIEAQIIYPGTWAKVTIVNRVRAMYDDGRVREDETEIMTFGKCFYGNQDATEWMKKDKIFKAALASAKKNYK
jgi:hypothetical protein